MNEPKDVSVWLLAPAHFHYLCDIAKALLQSCRIAGMRPQHPRLRRALGGTIAVLDGQLRLAVIALIMGANPKVPFVVSAALTQLRRGPPGRHAMLEQNIACRFGRAAWRGRQNQGRVGTARSTTAAVGSRDDLRERGSGSRCCRNCVQPAAPGFCRRRMWWMP